MKYFAALALGIFSLLFCFYLLFLMYKYPLVQHPIIEQARIAVDKRLFAGWTSVDPVYAWVHRYIFHNQDKYGFYPPRIIPQYTKQHTVDGYVVYAMVTNWNWQANLLTLSSYLGRQIYVRFEPTQKGPTAFLPQLDSTGNVIFEKTDVVDRIVPNWITLFCPSDILSVEAPSYTVFLYSSTKSPVVPKTITLVRQTAQPGAEADVSFGFVLTSGCSSANL
jgi:hypothetical protein